MPKFDDFLAEVRIGITQLAKLEAKDFVKQATGDSQQFVDALEPDLRLWTQQLEAGQLSKPDFEFLVTGKSNVAQMKALTQAGVTAIRIDQIRAALIKLIITAAGKMV
jgi:hypothetical protein